MLELNLIKSITKPDIFEDLGTGYWYYNYNIINSTMMIPKLTSLSTAEEENTMEMETIPAYSYSPIRISGTPTYSKCVLAVIRLYLTTNEEFDLVNSYNRYLLGETIDSKDLDKYKEYLNLVDTIKNNVSKDFERKSNNTSKLIKPNPSDFTCVISLLINNIEVPEELSLVLKDYYPKWENYINKNILKGIKVLYLDKLYKVLESHIVTKDSTPNTNTSLYKEITKE